MVWPESTNGLPHFSLSTKRSMPPWPPARRLLPGTAQAQRTADGAAAPPGAGAALPPSPGGTATLNQAAKSLAC